MMVDRGACPASAAAGTWTSSACTRRTPPSCSSPTSSKMRPPTSWGEERVAGFVALMQNLPREQVTIGVTALAIAEQAFADTLAYAKERPGVRPAHRDVPALPVRGWPRWPPRSQWRGEFTDQAIMGHRRPADQRGGLHGRVVGHRALQPRHRPLRPAARRLRLHAPVHSRPGLGRQPRPVDLLQRYHRDPGKRSSAAAWACRPDQALLRNPSYQVLTKWSTRS